MKFPSDIYSCIFVCTNNPYLTTIYDQVFQIFWVIHTNKLKRSRQTISGIKYFIAKAL